MDLFGLECWVDGEAFAAEYSSAVVDNVAPSRARLAKQLTARFVRPRTRNVLCPNIGASLWRRRRLGCDAVRISTLAPNVDSRWRRAPSAAKWLRTSSAWMRLAGGSQ